MSCYTDLLVLSDTEMELSLESSVVDKSGKHEHVHICVRACVHA